MKNNYPVKYAVIPITINNDISYYIASKCYLVNEVKKYNSNGTIENRYFVVCPFKNLDNGTWEKVEPYFNFNGNCTNSVEVDELYHYYGDAIKAKDKKNKDVFNKKVSHLAFDQNFYDKREQIVKEYDEIASYYNQLESLIEEKLIDLKMGFASKEQNIIIYNKKEYKKYNMSLYDAIKLYNNNRFISYTINKIEYNELLDTEEIITNNDKYNHTLLLINDNTRNIIKINGSYSNDKYLINEKIVDSNKDFIEPEDYDMVFYTMENYNDVVNSYTNLNNNDSIKLTRKII